MSEQKGNPDFWVAIATISPAVLDAFAATMLDLLTANRRRRVAEARKRGNKFLSI